jgi:hypothetical protein
MGSSHIVQQLPVALSQHHLPLVKPTAILFIPFFVEKASDRPTSSKKCAQVEIKILPIQAGRPLRYAHMTAKEPRFAKFFPRLGNLRH